MSKFEYGQIWLLNFDPSFGHEYRKTRPALIIQKKEFIDSSNLLTVIPISSQIGKQTELDVYLKRDANNRLMIDSLLKTKHISSFDKRRFIKLIGIIDKETLNKIKKNINIFLDC